MNSNLSHFAKKLPEEVEYARLQDPSFGKKNGILHGLVELLGRYVACVFQDKIPTNHPCHYFHDPRFQRFNPSDAFAFQTHPRSKLRLESFRPLFAIVLIVRFIQIGSYLGLKAIQPRNGLLRLAMLDLATIWTLVRRHDIKEFYYSASFQPYVFILCELRSQGVIVKLTGIQHGAWEKRSLENATRDLPLDEYRLLHERFEGVFRNHFDRTHQVIVSVQEPKGSINWRTREEPHIAVGLQYDNDQADFDIVKTCHQHCQSQGWDLVVYPHPKQDSKFIENIESLAIVERSNRYSDSACFVTRYSTLGMEFSLVGGAAIFVDYGERIEFDTEGLDVRYIKPSELQQTVAEVAAGVVLQ